MTTSPLTAEGIAWRVRRLHELEADLRADAVAAFDDAEALRPREQTRYGEALHGAAAGLGAARRALGLALSRLDGTPDMPRPLPQCRKAAPRRRGRVQLPRRIERLGEVALTLAGEVRAAVNRPGILLPGELADYADTLHGAIGELEVARAVLVRARRRLEGRGSRAGRPARPLPRRPQ